ncbi:MAG: hypothetical protein HKL86_10045 [Acidimicrobiaceae bacterium]|nr:hypothetical protein [Acidimicrobiaceae bacterium]
MHPHVTLSPRQFALAVGSVALGGALGTWLRDVLLKLQPAPATGAHAPWAQAIPWVLLGINFIGVFLATRLLAGPLRHHDPNDTTRLLVITGFFGGLTSYSGLFNDFGVLWHRSIGGCLIVAVAAILSGVLAAWLGLQRWFS